MTALRREAIDLDGDEVEAINEVILDERPDLGPRLDDLEFEKIVQPFFPRHKIVMALSELPLPPRSVVLALGPGGDGKPLLLTHNLERLHAVAAADAPQGLDDRARADSYAHETSDWTTDSVNGEMRLESFDHIPWHELDDDGRAEADRLRARFASMIQPERATQAAKGWAFHQWLVADRRLIERRLLVPRDGRLERTDLFHVKQLAVPEGKFWDTRDGRWVPIG